MRHLILGSGPAGIAAAKAIRGRDRKAVIAIATEEEASPYLRPFLTDLITGKQEAAEIADPQAADLSDKGIESRLGKRAAAVDPSAKTVTFSDGSVERYDVLLVATGGKPAIPPQLRKDFAAILPFDSLEDTLNITRRLKPSDRAAVYGPGFLAIVVSSALRKRGCEVVWFRPDTPRHGYPISGELEANILDSVRNTGVRILDGADIVSVREAEGGIEVVPSGGKLPVRCSAIVVATERDPSIGFLAGSGIRTGTGIMVDDQLRTSAPDVFAAGDCAEIFDARSEATRINFGWRSAMKQGRLAGENMAGAGKPYLPEESDFFWILFGPALLDRIK